MATYTAYDSNGGIGVTTSTGTNVDVPFPSTVNAGDTLILALMCHLGTEEYATPITDSQLWTVLGENHPDAGFRWKICMWIADGTETGNQTCIMTGSTSGDRYGLMFRFTHGSIKKGWFGGTSSITEDPSGSDNVEIDLGTNSNSSGEDALAVVIAIGNSSTTFSASGIGYTKDVDLTSAIGDGVCFELWSEDVVYNSADGSVGLNPPDWGMGLGFFLFGIPARRVFKIT